MYIYISSLSTLYTRTSKYVTTDEEHQKSIFAGICITIWYFMLQIKSFKIWSKIIERCLIKSNCFPICYDFFLVCFHEKFNFTKFFESFKVKNLPGWELKRRIHPWRRCTCSLRIWTSRSLWGGWPRCIRKVRHDIVF